MMQFILASVRLKIIGTNEDVQACLDIDNALDYEVELAVIIGKTGKNIPVDKVEDYIFWL